MFLLFDPLASGDWEIRIYSSIVKYFVHKSIKRKQQQQQQHD